MPGRAATEDPEIDRLLFEYALGLSLHEDNNARGGEVGRFDPTEDPEKRSVVPRDPPWHRQAERCNGFWWRHRRTMLCDVPWAVEDVRCQRRCERGGLVAGAGDCLLWRRYVRS